MSKMSRLIFAGFFLLAVSTAAPSAFAGTINAPATPDPSANLDPPGNLLINGSFQSGDFTGWTTGGTFNHTFVTGPFDGYVSQDADGFFAALGAVGGDATLSQSFTDTPGQAYTFSFYYAGNGTGPADFNALYDSVPLMAPLTDYNSNNAYTLFSFTVAGTGHDMIQFNARNDPDYDALDNVSFSSATSTTPEPSSAGLILIGFGLLAGVAWRRRRTAC